MSTLNEDMRESLDLSMKITEILPQKPENIGIPIMALQIAKSNYIQFIRNNINKNQIESFENMLRQTELQIEQLVGIVSDKNRNDLD